MAIVNSNISSSLVRPNFAPGSVDLVYGRTDFLDWLERKGLTGTTGGSSPVTWPVIYSGNSSSETFVENQALPSAGKPTWAKASQSVFYVRDVVSVTGHVLDQIRNGGTYEDVWQSALAEAMKRLRYYLEQQLLGSTADVGIASIIDSADTYAGLDVSTYTLWASEENGSVSTLTETAMSALYEELMCSDHGATVTDILCPPNQLFNYGEIGGAMTASASLNRFNIDSGRPFDVGKVNPVAMPSFNGIPLTPIGAMTTTEIYFLDATTPIALLTHRDFQVETLAKTNDNTEAVISWGGLLQVKNRHVHGKMTGVTA